MYKMEISTRRPTPARRPISKTGSADLIPKDEDEALPLTYTEGKIPFGDVAKMVRFLAMLVSVDHPALRR